MTPQPPRETRFLSGVSIAFLLLATSYQLFCAFQDIPFLNQYVLRMDDAYYYFQVARNIADKGWVTFDGIHATSGLQVLWGVVLAVMAELVHDRVAFLRAVFVLSAVLNATAGLMLRRLGRNLYSTDVGNVAAIAWSGFMLGLSPTMIGVEYPLHVVIILATLSAWWTIHLVPREATYWRLSVLGLLLTLNYWTRLDSASLSLMVAIAVSASLLTAGTPWRTAARQVATLGVWPLLGGLGYVAICLAVAQTPMPISGLVKAQYAAQHFAQYGWLTSLAGHISWWVRVEARPIVDAASGALLANHQPLVRFIPLAILTAALALTVWSAVQMARERRHDVRQYRVMMFLGLLWTFSAIHAVVIVKTIGPFSHVTQHYYGWLFITWCLWAALMMQRLLQRTPSVTWLPRAGALGLLACLIGGNTAVAWRKLTLSPDMTTNLHNRRLPVIAWINEHLPADARLGAWNAGQIGYFCDRTVVNLDGLANDGEYFATLKKGSSITEYLRHEHIGYLVDNNALDLTMPYQASWDHTRFFHRTEPWADLETVYEEAGQADPIMVLHVRGVSPPANGGAEAVARPHTGT